MKYHAVKNTKLRMDPETARRYRADKEPMLKYVGRCLKTGWRIYELV